MLKIILLCALLLAAPGINRADAPVIPVQGPPLSESERARLIKETIEILGGGGNVVSAWVDDIRFASFGQVSPDLHDYARTIIGLVSEETRLALTIIDQGTGEAGDQTGNYHHQFQKTADGQQRICDKDNPEVCANFVVFIGTNEQMRQLLEILPMRSVYHQALAGESEIECFFAPKVEAGSAITRSFVYINSNQTEQMIQTCLQEEIVQSFGLFSDVTDSAYYSFNNVVAPKQLTYYDLLLLRTVYDPTLGRGAAVFRIARKIDALTRQQLSD